MQRSRPGWLRRAGATLALAAVVGLGGFEAGTWAAQPGGGAVHAAAAIPAGAGAYESVAQQVGPAVVSIRTDQGQGSGVIYDPSGLVLTNAHVIADAQRITVVLADGRRMPGRVLGADPGFDLAVVKVDGQNLPVAPLGDSTTLHVGQPVVAIGNPYGFDNTLTAGVVSALNRPISEGPGSYSQPMIQTDAAINPGNSGGPLLDLQGNVIGITTLVAAPQGFPAQGLGFAVPVETAKRIAPQLATDGRVSHSGQPYLGVRFGTAAPGGIFPYQPPQALPAGVDHGVLVGAVDPSGPAAQAGLRAGDVVTNFDGREIYGRDELLAALVVHKPGDQVRMTVNRGGQTVTLTVTIGEAPAAQ